MRVVSDEPPDEDVALFDDVERERWLSTSRRQLVTARALTAGAFHESGVLHSEQSAQCALQGLLHAVGAVREARGHSLVDLVAACEDRAALVLPDDLRAALGELAAQYQPSRYPDALPGGTPEEHYGAGAAERAMTTATRVLKSVEAHLEAFRTAGDHEHDTDDG